MEGEREMGECSGLFFYKDTNIIMATTLLTSHEPKYLSKALPPNIITLRVRASPCEICVWGGGHKYSVHNRGELEVSLITKALNSRVRIKVEMVMVVEPAVTDVIARSQMT